MPLIHILWFLPALCGPARIGCGETPLSNLEPMSVSCRIGLNAVWDGRGGTGAIPDPVLADRLMRDVLDSGARIVRIGVSWASIEPERGAYLWADTDRLVEFLVGCGFDPGRPGC